MERVWVGALSFSCVCRYWVFREYIRDGVLLVGFISSLFVKRPLRD